MPEGTAVIGIPLFNVRFIGLSGGAQNARATPGSLHPATSAIPERAASSSSWDPLFGALIGAKARGRQIEPTRDQLTVT